MGKLIRLDIQGDFDSGFSVTAQILEDSAPFPLIAGDAGKLPRNLDIDIKEAYRNWQTHYRSIVAPIPKFPLTDRPSFTNVSGNIQENDFEPFRRETQDLIMDFNNWLKNQDFQPIELLLRTHLEPGEKNRILLLTNNPWLRKLPWHEWDLLRDFPQTEVGFSSPNFQQLKQISVSQDKVKILAILGYQADIVSQGQPIQNLGNHVEVTWLKQPKREELDEPLWKQQWDILFFVGHGESQDDWKTGTIWINENDKITIGELRNHFKKAIDNGLKLAILNCCDGLGLAHSLAEGEDLYLPQIIAMREELPVAIAPRFLQDFMEEFTQDNSLYASVREARRRLQILEKEFPCASHLPVICQNPAVKPLRWHDLVIPPNPYQGLSAFQEKDAALFFGRETFTNQLVKVVETKKLVAVIGASGIGKSSVVLAGLIPSLRQQGNWLIANLRPESTPFENLAKALLSPMAQLETGESEGIAEINADEINQLAIDLQEGNRTLSDVVRSIGSSRRFLLVIDQFEEIYTYQNQNNQQFLDCLLDAVQNFSAFRLVITLRADFLGQAIEYNPFREQLDRWKPEFIGGMVRTELQAAIEEPAKKRNVYLEAGLTEHILNDVGGEQGNLPLLEFALTELWKQQENGLLTRLKYDEIGGVEKALCRHAEGVYDALKEGDKERIKQIFMKLVSPAEGTEYTRQLATRAEVGEENWDLVTHLATARLVVSNRNETTEIETVEIVHEALIKAWPDLRKWIEENDTFLRWKKRLKVAFLEWERNENQEGYLLQGAPLGEAEGYLQQRLEDINPAEQKFINLSLEKEKTRQQRELEQERKARKAAQTRTRVAVASTVIVSAAGIFAFWQRNEAIKGQINALAAEAESRFSAKEQLGALLASVKTARQLKQSFGLSANDRIQTLVKIQQPIYKIQERNRIEGHSDSVYTVSFSPDGKLIASGSRDNTVKLWSRDGTLVKTFEGQTGSVSSVSFSPDSKMIVSTAGVEGIARLWNIDGTLVKTLNAPHNYILGKVIFSPDGKLIASSARSSPSQPGIAILWNPDGSLFKILVTDNDDGRLSDVTWSPDSSIIITASTSFIRFWKKDGSLLKSWEIKNANYDASVIVRFSPDGKMIALAYGDNTVKIFDTDGKLLKILNKSNPGTFIWDFITEIEFSPDGKMIAMASGDKTVKLFDIKQDFAPLVIFAGHTGSVYGVSFSPDGKTIASASSDGTIRLWKMESPNVLYGYIRDLRGELSPLQFSSDGKTVINSNFPEPIDAKLWNIDGTLIKTLKIKDELGIRGFSPDNQRLLIVDDKGFKLINWSEDIVHQFIEDRKVTIATFSPDGKFIASANEDKNIKIWSADGNLIKTIISDQNKVDKLYFNRRANKIAIISRNKVKIFTLDGELVTHFDIKLNARIVTISPDFQFIATYESGTKIQLWDLQGKLITTLIHREQINDDNEVASIAFSPDSKIIATGYRDLNLWGLDGKLIARIPGYEATIEQISFSPNGKTIGIIQRHPIARGPRESYIPSASLWSLDLDSILVSGCNLLGDYLKTNPNVSESDRTLCNE
ncbi:CHAT domain-containing protein [Microcoleus sp. LEGE 07076]|uniref:nSTAND1 domain-containing NTPase n=1 Tax=Microcoleus sp. LEGE 07076 TaxID=915322 RepID=UPI001882FD36|nr:CHAT domain-containing protein [Microcoleus sp. LEGE 07076]MBE9187437.1 CHAT domain-containing protein [Microcoleus sp. LEGE 07076]